MCKKMFTHGLKLVKYILMQPKILFAVLHQQTPVGNTFKLLGVMIDIRLNMADEAQRILKKARSKVKAIWSTRSHLSVKDMIKQFKSHIFCLMEFSALSIFHAAPTHLNDLDYVQDHFGSNLGLALEEAFVHHNLLPVRRIFAQIVELLWSMTTLHLICMRSTLRSKAAAALFFIWHVSMSHTVFRDL